MSKKLLSTILLFAIAVGFSFVAFYQFTQSHDILLGIVYLSVPIAALYALFRLPYRADASSEAQKNTDQASTKASANGHIPDEKADKQAKGEAR
ncbi:MAG TPA: hypothetical protein VKQ36_16990 [Ktedonobacterales bacterium]|nr:hypothetical protein [Ktedonobacterales bacterium]